MIKAHDHIVQQYGQNVQEMYIIFLSSDSLHATYQNEHYVMMHI